MKKPYTKQKPFSPRRTTTEFFLKIDATHFLLIDNFNKLIIQPARSGFPYTRRRVYF